MGGIADGLGTDVLTATVGNVGNLVEGVTTGDYTALEEGLTEDAMEVGGDLVGTVVTEGTTELLDAAGMEDPAMSEALGGLTGSLIEGAATGAVADAAGLDNGVTELPSEAVPAT